MNNKILNSATSRRNNLKAWKWFEQHGYKSHTDMVLHHKDIYMKKNDPERYIQWNVEDLVVMDIAQHRKLHMKIQTKGKKHTKQHNLNISQSMKEQHAKGKLIRIYVAPVKEQVHYFKTMSDAAKFIGCSKQLVSQCIRKKQHNRRARGWTVTLVDSIGEDK